MKSEIRDLYIVGAGGFAREVLGLLSHTPVSRCGTRWRLAGFVDNAGHVDMRGVPVISDDQFTSLDSERGAVIAVGEPTLRAKIAAKYAACRNLVYPTFVHPRCFIQDTESVRLGAGNILCAGTILTTDIAIGNHNVINLSCTIGHDVAMGDFNVINPSVNVSGGVHVEDRCFIGVGAQILQNLTVSCGSVIGAGAVVTRNVEANTTVIGIPAKLLQRSTPHV